MDTTTIDRALDIVSAHLIKIISNPTRYADGTAIAAAQALATIKIAADVAEIKNQGNMHRNRSGRSMLDENDMGIR